MYTATMFPFMMDNPKAISFVVVLLFAFLYYQYRALHIETSQLRKAIGTVATRVSQATQALMEPHNEPQQQHHEDNELPYPYNQNHDDADDFMGSYSGRQSQPMQMSNERNVKDERKRQSQTPQTVQSLQHPRSSMIATGRHGTNAEPAAEPMKTKQAPRRTARSAEEDDFDIESGGVEQRYKS